jgi:hypothetical protein
MNGIPHALRAGSLTPAWSGHSKKESDHSAHPAWLRLSTNAHLGRGCCLSAAGLAPGICVPQSGSLPARGETSARANGVDCQICAALRVWLLDILVCVSHRIGPSSRHTRGQRPLRPLPAVSTLGPPPHRPLARQPHPHRSPGQQSHRRLPCLR